jgi:hypothetical protein
MLPRHNRLRLNTAALQKIPTPIAAGVFFTVESSGWVIAKSSVRGAS